MDIYSSLNEHLQSEVHKCLENDNKNNMSYTIHIYDDTLLYLHVYIWDLWCRKDDDEFETLCNIIHSGLNLRTFLHCEREYLRGGPLFPIEGYILENIIESLDLKQNKLVMVYTSK